MDDVNIEHQRRMWAVEQAVQVCPETSVADLVLKIADAFYKFAFEPQIPRSESAFRLPVRGE